MNVASKLSLVGLMTASALVFAGCAGDATEAPSDDGVTGDDQNLTAAATQASQSSAATPASPQIQQLPGPRSRRGRSGR